MYGLVIQFDEETDYRFQQLWDHLERLGLSSYGSEVEGRRPHLTLANMTNIEGFSLHHVMGHMPPFPSKLTCKTVGTFSGTQTLFAGPVPSKRLLDWHSKLHLLLGRNSNPHSHYAPEHWVPHVTIASRLGESMAEVFRLCLDIEPFEMRPVEVVLIRVIETDSGLSVKEIEQYPIIHKRKTP